MPIRQATPADYPAITAVHNTLFPDLPRVPEQYHEVDARRDARCKHATWVCEVQGQVVASAHYDQSIWMYHPGHFFISVEVLPAHQARGIGGALSERLMAALEPFEPVQLQARAYQQWPQGVSFLQGRGFHEHARDASSHLDVTVFDFAPYDGLVDKLRAEGIDFKTLRELESRPDRDRQLYELDIAIIPYLPGGEDLTLPDFEAWVEEVLGEPALLPDAYFIALDGDTVIGSTSLLANRACPMLHQGLTAVRREYWGRGIATALKVQAIAYARENGRTPIETTNEVGNARMLAVNNRLGFVKQPDRIDMLKQLSASGDV